MLSQDRTQHNSNINRGRRLFQELLVDEFARTEHQRLTWCEMNQHILRADLYCGVRDALRADAGATAGSIGRTVILPSTVISSPRHMLQLYQDALAIVRARGAPSLFTTATCNPQWPELVEELRLAGASHWSDRPDLVARVFKLKMDALLNDLTQRHVLGRVIAHMHVVEWQKG